MLTFASIDPKKITLLNSVLRLSGWAALFFLAATVSVAGQAERNPFELIPRLEREEAAQALDELSQTRGTGNPFDLIAPSAEKVEPAPRRRDLSREDSFQRFFFITTIALLLLFASLLSLFRGYFRRAFQAFLSDNMLNQAQRDTESGRAAPFYLFYVFFLINAGILALLVVRHYGYTLTSRPLFDFLFCFAGIALLVVLKHLLLSFIGGVFPVEKETSTYSFMIVIFGILLGVALLPANLLIVYGPENTTAYALYGALGLMGLVLLFRTLRALFLAGQYLAFHTFHFLLYICTVEIAPVLILIKLITRQL